jgi:hypothetical protein
LAYKSPFWKDPFFLPNFYWVAGFTEAEGSFYIVKKDKERAVHGFGWTQKNDPHILESLRTLFKINAKVKWNQKGFWSLDSTSEKSIVKATFCFKNLFKGMKSSEWRIWSRSYYKYKGNTDK